MQHDKLAALWGAGKKDSRPATKKELAQLWSSGKDVAKPATKKNLPNSQNKILDKTPSRIATS